ncbi:hypothetical protein EVAR_38274_1 [Eumeta japonica]|uniref:Uncharacterized protein n=1 Tax=Eumeta variegata TaxID=151549 RepID=A0A4C1W825_EUMVA|nr:hypothetical protein EVAR_38274_1 [Eumeta japonica]
MAAEEVGYRKGKWTTETLMHWTKRNSWVYRGSCNLHSERGRVLRAPGVGAGAGAQATRTSSGKKSTCKIEH